MARTDLRHVTRCTLKKFVPFLKFNLEGEILNLKIVKNDQKSSVIGPLEKFSHENRSLTSLSLLISRIMSTFQ
jgi:hypothetical protein